MSDSAVAAAYDARAAEYIDLLGGIEQTDPADRAFVARWRDATDGELLDAGCGPGLWTDFLHDGARAVSGIDLSAEFIAAARSCHPHLRFVEGSFAALPVEDASLGGILAWYSLIHLPPSQLPAVLAEFARVIAPGGSLLVGFFDGEPGEPFAHAIAPAYFWSADALVALLADAGFTVIERDRRERGNDEPSRRPHGAVVAIRG